MNGDLRGLAKLHAMPIVAWKSNLARSFREAWWLSRRPQQVSYYCRLPGRKMLNIGCGANMLPGWLNTDFSPGDSRAVFLDATQRFPLKDESFDYVFSEHMIEHVPYDHALAMLGECHRVLRKGGRIRVATPDLRRIVGLFAEAKSDAEQEYIHWFIDKFAHAEEFRFYHEVFVLNRMVREWGHQFIYDDWVLRQALHRVGFKDCSRYNAGESEDAALQGIDGHNDVSGHAMNSFETMVIEAVK
jgi:predicted SAM-dependent methyltransferase